MEKKFLQSDEDASTPAAERSWLCSARHGGAQETISRLVQLAKPPAISGVSVEIC